MQPGQGLQAKITPNMHKKAPYRVTRGLPGLHGVKASLHLHERRLGHSGQVWLSQHFAHRPLRLHADQVGAVSGRSMNVGVQVGRVNRHTGG